MRFDHFEDSQPADVLIPDGTHECEIVKVKDIKTKDGREVTVVELSQVDGTYDKVAKFLDAKERRDCKAAMQLLSALGLPGSTHVDDKLEGMRVQVTTKRATRDGEPLLDNAGKQKIWINGFSASRSPAFESFREPEPVAKPAARTATKKADAAGTAPNDDIPF